MVDLEARFLPPPPTLAVLELVAQRQEGEVKDRAEASAQAAVVDRVRVLQIVLEHLDELACERAVHEGHVELVVERKRAIVEVGAADADPALIDHERLGVEQRRTVLVDRKSTRLNSSHLGISY